MVIIRKNSERGSFDHGWLKTAHTFSFGDYVDPKWMGFESLRVINEDWVAAGKGFGTHPHRDMEIVTYMIEGQIAHRDSMGNGSVIQTGEIQYMSAGTGVTHSEVNPSQQQDAHLLQIWIKPDQRGYEPRYGQMAFSQSELRGQWKQLIGPDQKAYTKTEPTTYIKIRQNASIFARILTAQETVEYFILHERSAWLQVVSGQLSVSGDFGRFELAPGDGVGLKDTEKFEISAFQDTHCLLFDL